jgi:hypothetical protein
VAVVCAAQIASAYGLRDSRGPHYLIKSTTVLSAQKDNWTRPGLPRNLLVRQDLRSGHIIGDTTPIHVPLQVSTQHVYELLAKVKVGEHGVPTSGEPPLMVRRLERGGNPFGRARGIRLKLATKSDRRLSLRRRNNRDSRQYMGT